MMELYFASTKEFVVGTTFGQNNAPTPGHLKRCAGDASWARMEVALEGARQANEHSRATGYYTTATLPECVIYIQSRPPKFDASGKVIPPPPFFYYRVEAPSATRGVMALVYRGMDHLDHPAELAEICEEYWRQPLRGNGWSFYEYICPSMTILERLSHPGEDEMQGMLGFYFDDRNAAEAKWPKY